jgi:phosphate starvation-inducible PhoH-like protein
MKMFLTRIGFGATAVITGDLTQVDLPKHQKSGLRDALDVLKGVEGMSFTEFDAGDVVRHPLVARIVQAYDRRDAARATPPPSGDTA